MMQDLRPLYRRQLFEVLRKGLAPLTAAQGERINAQQHHLLQRLMKHRTSYYNSSKKYLLAIELQWETRKLIFPLKRKNWPELSKLAVSFTLGKKRHSPYRLQMPTHTLEILQALTGAKHWDHLPTLAFPISFSKVSSNSKCFKWAPITDA